jgi:hypothetical protein
VSGLVEAAHSTAASKRIWPGSTSKEGVDAVLFDTEINYFYGGLFMPVRLMVLDEDLDEALRVLRDYNS